MNKCLGQARSLSWWVVTWIDPFILFWVFHMASYLFLVSYSDFLRVWAGFFSHAWLSPRVPLFARCPTFSPFLNSLAIRFLLTGDASTQYRRDDLYSLNWSLNACARKASAQFLTFCTPNVGTKPCLPVFPPWPQHILSSLDPGPLLTHASGCGSSSSAQWAKWLGTELSSFYSTDSPLGPLYLASY